jgi:hypothetical protein
VGEVPYYSLIKELDGHALNIIRGTYCGILWMVVIFMHHTSASTEVPYWGWGFNRETGARSWYFSKMKYKNKEPFG